MCGIVGACDDSDGFFLNEFYLVEVLLRYAAKNNWAIV
jgi:hypothetical protein